jgi:hypothetical protein
VRPASRIVPRCSAGLGASAESRSSFLERVLRLDEGEQRAARLGEARARAAAHEQHRLELLLEAGDPARQRGLAQVEEARRARERARARDRGEGVELVLVERHRR